MSADEPRQALIHPPSTEWREAATRPSRGPRRRNRLLILGTGEFAKDLCRSVLRKRGKGYEVVGFVDRDGSQIGQRLVNPYVIGSCAQLFQIVELRQVDTIAVCLEDRRGGLPVQTLLDLKSLGVRIMDGHELYERESGRLSIDLVKPSVLIFSTGFRRYAIAMTVKRLFDTIASMCGVILLLPLWLVVSALIRIDSPGPVFYRQVRTGFHGHPFRLWKFRSMGCDAENEGAQWATIDDPRMTRVGRWLRKWRMDELPQLLNVIKGEMRLVGPRPERAQFVQELREVIPYYDVRHTVRPGITGWAQIRYQYAGSTDESHKKLQYDLYYVKNLSLWLDIRILVESIRVVLRGDGAR